MLKKAIPTLAIAGLALNGCGSDDDNVFVATCKQFQACFPVDFANEHDSVGECAQYYADQVADIVDAQAEEDQADCRDAELAYFACYASAESCDDEVDCSAENTAINTACPVD